MQLEVLGGVDDGRGNASEVVSGCKRMGRLWKGVDVQLCRVYPGDVYQLYAELDEMRRRYFFGRGLGGGRAGVIVRGWVVDRLRWLVLL